MARSSAKFDCLLSWDAGLGDRFHIRTGDRFQEQAPMKLSYKHLTVVSTELSSTASHGSQIVIAGYWQEGKNQLPVQFRKVSVSS